MRKKLLLVDENKAISFLIRTIVGKNFDTVQVDDGYFAMKEIVTGHLFDVMIISINETDSDNFQLLRHISTSSVLKTIPVMVLAPFNQKKLKKACIGLAVDEYIEKPFDPLDFTEKLAKLTEPATENNNDNGQSKYSLYL